jgi:hypothetical protein
VITNEQKFQKALTVDAYRDINKISKIFMNWKKGKLLQQTELKERLEVEKEAASLMTHISKMSLTKPMLKDLYHMCSEMMNRYNKCEKRDTFQIIMNFTNMNQNSTAFQTDPNKLIVTSSARIKKNFSFTSQKTVDRGKFTKVNIIVIVTPKDRETMSIHHSLQRESHTGKVRKLTSIIETDALFDYPTSVSVQSSHKNKHKKSLPIDTGDHQNTSNGFIMSQPTSVAKNPSKFSEIYGVKSNKAKKSVNIQKSSTLKMEEQAFDKGVQIFNNCIAQSMFMDHTQQKDVSLPYIQSSQSSKASSVVNTSGMKPKKNNNKYDINKVGNIGKNSHKFVAIYSNSNQVKPKLVTKASFKDTSEGGPIKGTRYK